MTVTVTVEYEGPDVSKLIVGLERERRDLIAQMKRSHRDHGEGRRLNQIDTLLAALSKRKPT